MPTVGQAIKTLRIEAGVTQQELAERLGLAQSRVSAMERDERPPSLTRIQEIEDALELERGAILRAAGHVKVNAGGKRTRGEAPSPEVGEVDLYEVTMGLQAAVDELSRVAKALGYKIVPADRRETEG